MLCSLHPLLWSPPSPCCGRGHLVFVDRERVLCVLLCQCVWTPVRLCFPMSAAVCQWVYETEYMCVPVRGPGAGRALLRSRLPRRHCGHVPLHPTPPFCPLLDGRAVQALGEVIAPNPSLLPATWLPVAAKSPPAGPGPGAPQVHKLTLPPPLHRWEPARSPRPHWPGGGPRVAAPSPRLHPPGAGPRRL